MEFNNEIIIAPRIKLNIKDEVDISNIVNNKLSFIYAKQEIVRYVLNVFKDDLHSYNGNTFSIHSPMSSSSYYNFCMC